VTLDPGHRRDRILNALCCALIAIVVMIAFARLFNADFTNWDDAHTIVENPDFKPPTGTTFVSLWTKPRAHLYVPATYSAWWILAKAKFAPQTFHAANIALHAAAACVVFAILRRVNLSRALAVIGALIFALHPVQVEPVGWASGLKDVLCGLLTAVALWQYIVYAQMQTTRAYVISCAAFLLAMLSKPTAAMFPLMAVAIDALLLRRKLADIVRGIVPLALFAIPTLIAAAQFQDASKADTILPLPWRPIVALDAIAFYLGKLVWPFYLALDYGRHPQALRAAGDWRWTMFIPIALCALLILAHRRWPALLAGAILYVAPLIPLLGLKPFDFQQYSTVADHYLYIPMIGAALIVATLLTRVRMAGVAIGALLCLALAIRTFDQSKHWRNSEALWTHAIAINPDSWVSYLNLGEHYVSSEQPDRAIDPLMRSIDLRDNDPARLNLGVVYLDRKNPTEAIRQFERAIELNPRSIEAHVNLAYAYLQVANFGSAIKEYEMALRLDPHNEKARKMLPQVREFVRTHQATRPTTNATSDGARPVK
jgi:tetratricopeptide (TPR) repeat protein